MKAFSCLALGLVIILSGCSHSGSETVVRGSGGGGAVTLRLRPKTGTTYLLDSTREAPGIAGEKKTLHAVMSMKILSSSTKEVKMESTTESTDDPNAKDLKETVMTLTFDPRYHILEAKVSQGGQSSKAIETMMTSALKMSPVFPEEAVHVGDSWTVPVDMGAIFSSLAQGTMTVTGETKPDMKLTFTKIGKEAGREVAIVDVDLRCKMTFTVQGKDMPVELTSTGSSSFDLETGMGIASSMTTKQATTTPDGKASESTTVTNLKLKSIE